MITEALVSMFESITLALIGLLPSWTAPGWLTTTLPAGISTVAGYTTGLGAWFPFAEAGAALALVLVMLAAALAIKVVRIVLSLFTAGGGSAG